MIEIFYAQGIRPYLANESGFRRLRYISYTDYLLIGVKGSK